MATHHVQPTVILEWSKNGCIQIGFSGESKPRYSSCFSSSSSSNNKNNDDDTISSYLSNVLASHLLLSGKSRSVLVLETDLTCHRQVRREIATALLQDLKAPRILFLPAVCTIPYTLGIRHVACVVQCLSSDSNNNCNHDEAQITIWWRGRVLIPQILIIVKLEDIDSGIQECLSQKCPIDLRKEARQNVILSGRVDKIPTEKMEQLTSSSLWKIRTTPFAPPYTSWVGASILCQTQDLSNERWMTFNDTAVSTSTNDQAEEKKETYLDPYDYLFHS